jgi:hypothetical protein
MFRAASQNQIFVPIKSRSLLYNSAIVCSKNETMLSLISEMDRLLDRRPASICEFLGGSYCASRRCRLRPIRTSESGVPSYTRPESEEFGAAVWVTPIEELLSVAITCGPSRMNYVAKKSRMLIIHARKGLHFVAGR